MAKRFNLIHTLPFLLAAALASPACGKGGEGEPQEETDTDNKKESEGSSKESESESDSSDSESESSDSESDSSDSESEGSDSESDSDDSDSGGDDSDSGSKDSETDTGDSDSGGDSGGEDEIPDEYKGQENPMSSDEDIEAGMELYKTHKCASCHKADGSGTLPGTSLVSSEAKEWGDDRLLWKISEGVSKTSMKAYKDDIAHDKDKPEDSEMWKLIAAIRKLQK